MSTQLFSLSGVPDDEADEIRELLSENEIDYYETPANRWGISAAMIYLKDKKQLEKARSLIAKYQAERAYAAREEYERLKREGKSETIIDKIKQAPIKVIFYLALIALILYLSIKPFIDFGK